MKVTQELRNYIVNFFKGNTRTVKIKKHVTYSMLIRGTNILLGLVTVPLTLKYLNKAEYGIWLTIGSFLNWMEFFNIGLDHGFRNRFAEAIAKGKHTEAKKYVSTTYFILGVISLFILVTFFIVNQFLDWSNILNASPDLSESIKMLMNVIVISFSVQFVFKIIQTVLLADQRPSFGYLFNLIGKILSIVVILVLIQTTEGSLLYYGVFSSLIPVAILLIANIFFYRGKYKPYKPSFAFIELSYLKNLMHLGAKFFLIQIAVIVIYSTDNLIITRLFSPEEVPPYQISLKYFNIVLMGFTIIVSTFWSPFTEAWIKKDIDWIKKSIKKLQLIWLLFFGLTVIMVLIAKPVYKFWLQGALEIPWSLTLAMAFYVLIQAYASIFVNFVNGTSKVMLQFYVSIFSAVLNIPLSILFARTFNMGTPGVILATIISISYGIFIAPIQYRKIINNKAKGIWNK